MRIWTFILLTFIASVLNAETIDYQEFSKQIDQIENHFNLASRKNFILDDEAADSLMKLSGVTEVKAVKQNYVLNLSWIGNVSSQIKSEDDLNKRKLIYTNLVDTLVGFRTELTFESENEGATRKEMEDALERAMKKTMPIILSRGASIDESIEWSGEGACVMEGSGDGISVINAQNANSGYSGYRRSNGVRGFASGGSSGSYGSYSGKSFSKVNGSNSSSSSSRHFSNNSFSKQPVKNTGHFSSQNTSYHKAPQNNSSNSSRSSPSGSNFKPSNSGSRKTKPPTPTPTPRKVPPPPKPKTNSSITLIYWLVGIVFVIGLFSLLFFIYKKLQEKILNEEVSLEKEESQLATERMKTETIYDMAVKAAEAGNYEEAIRLLTVGSLLLLEKQQIVDFKDSLTNGEYLHELLAERKRHELFKKPLSIFDRIIYGFAKTEKSDYELFKSFYLELEKLEG